MRGPSTVADDCVALSDAEAEAVADALHSLSEYVAQEVACDFKTWILSEPQVFAEHLAAELGDCPGRERLTTQRPDLYVELLAGIEVKRCPECGTGAHLRWDATTGELDCVQCGWGDG